MSIHCKILCPWASLEGLHEKWDAMAGRRCLCSHCCLEQPQEADSPERRQPSLDLFASIPILPPPAKVPKLRFAKPCPTQHLSSHALDCPALLLCSQRIPSPESSVFPCHSVTLATHLDAGNLTVFQKGPQIASQEAITFSLIQKPW